MWGIGNACRAGDRGLQLFVLNEEFLVGAGQQPAPTTSLPFVHTARRYYRLDGRVRRWGGESILTLNTPKPVHLEEVKVVTRFP